MEQNLMWMYLKLDTGYINGYLKTGTLNKRRFSLRANLPHDQDIFVFHFAHLSKLNQSDNASGKKHFLKLKFI